MRVFNLYTIRILFFIFDCGDIRNTITVVTERKKHFNNYYYHSIIVVAVYDIDS